MSPSFNDGDFVLGLKKWLKPAPGQVLLIDHPRYGRIIKRVIDCNESGLRLAGDNAKEGVSSEEIGLINQDQIIAKVIWRSKA